MSEPDAVHYVCKYTPVELLEGFGVSAVRCDPRVASFECAESCAHPNLCGYGKAVLEEVLDHRIESLLLVDCCDVCRRIYDVLKDQGTMKFLFLMSLPHKDGEREVALLARELRRLSAALEKGFGRSLDQRRAMAAWQRAAHVEQLAEPHVLLTGAHGGALLWKRFARGSRFRWWMAPAPAIGGSLPRRAATSSRAMPARCSNRSIPA